MNTEQLYKTPGDGPDQKVPSALEQAHPPERPPAHIDTLPSRHLFLSEHPSTSSLRRDGGADKRLLTRP